MIQQKISVREESKGSFTVYDCTGKYSSSNKGGYGSPNYKVTDIVSSTLFVHAPSDTEEYPHEIDVTGDLPNDEDVGLEVFPSEIGQQSGPESGKYKFKLVTVFTTISGAQKTKTAYYTCVLTKTLSCCVDTLRGTYPTSDAERRKKINEISNLFMDVEFQVGKGLYDSANTTIDYLKAQCECPGC